MCCYAYESRTDGAKPIINPLVWCLAGYKYGVDVHAAYFSFILRLCYLHFELLDFKSLHATCVMELKLQYAYKLKGL